MSYLPKVQSFTGRKTKKSKKTANDLYDDDDDEMTMMMMMVMMMIVIILGSSQRPFIPLLHADTTGIDVKKIRCALNFCRRSRETYK